jgi:phage terminase small subunit
MKKLSEKQELFCLNYLIDMNATQAAIRAGYNRQSVRWLGYNLKRRPKIRARIQELMDERSGRTLMDADYVVDNLVRVVNRCMQLEPKMKWDEERRKWVDVGYDDFNPDKALRALQLLGRHVGLFERKSDGAGSGNAGAQSEGYTYEQLEKLVNLVRNKSNIPDKGE